MKYGKLCSIIGILFLLSVGYGTTEGDTVMKTNQPQNTEHNKPGESVLVIEGLVIEKTQSPGNQILVAANLYREMLANKTKEEIEVISMKEDLAYYRIETEIFNKVEVGMEVVIFLNTSNEQLEMYPPIRFPESVEIKTTSSYSIDFVT
ncbi:hypothetical protein [Oceanobacillus damuensis]|uniref:hypothetical protein n=1 Tax=Oceanobacillus damuensis TaxID=937928 RepID=UPI00082D5BBD|nr:hypothetical protein [Oceanobacillus damuensis]